MQQPAHLRIDITDAGEVCVFDFALESVRDRSFRRNPLEAVEIASSPHGEGGGTARWILIRRESDSTAVVKVPISFRCIEGQMRFIVAHCEEEGLVL